ncbi:MAG: polymerase ECF-type sigma factor [Solirubrobacterales bacterium]|jgi:RNA polymerase sigma-70 factor (ECF subfamily)|nr:polymerase ECF-type sigma factor [Solirubrobacterales bacterium]
MTISSGTAPSGALHPQPAPPAARRRSSDAAARRMRTRADRLHSADNGRLTARRELVESPEDIRVVAAAVARAREGDREATRYIYLRYSDNVYGFVRTIVRDDYEAEDVTQQVFAKLLTALVKYEPREVPFTRWVLRLAHNCAIDHLRRRTPTPVEDVRSDDRRHDDGGADRSLSLQEALATLPEDQRNVVVMRHMFGLSPGEIARRLGRTESSVHGLHHRGRGELRRQLEELGAAPVTMRRAVAP